MSFVPLEEMVSFAHSTESKLLRTLKCYDDEVSEEESTYGRKF